MGLLEVTRRLLTDAVRHSPGSSARGCVSAGAALLDLWEGANHGPAAIGETTETLLGVPARTYRQWARENAAAFTAE